VVHVVPLLAGSQTAQSMPQHQRNQESSEPRLACTSVLVRRQPVAIFDGEICKRGSIADADLVIDPVEVDLDRAFGNIQFTRNHFVGRAIGDK